MPGPVSGEPLVDVLLPVRDAAATLPEVLADLRRQSLARFRCLVLDDGSSDASARRAEEAAAADPRFLVHRLERRGLVAALNEGLRRARSPFLARVDADDRIHPERLERQVRHLLDHREVHVVACRVEFFGRAISAGLAAYRDWLNSLLTHEEIVRDLFVESPLPHPAVTLRTDALRQLGGYRDRGGPEDYDLWLRGWRAGWRFAKLPQRLVAIRDHEGRLTRRDPRYAARAFLECKADHLVEAWGLAGGEIVVWGAGRDGKRAAKALRRRGVRLRCLVDVAPTKIGRRMLGVEVLPAATLRRKPGCPLVVAVGVPGARAEIRAALAAWGYREGDEFVCFG